MSEWILNFSWEKKNKMAKIEKFGPEKKKFSGKKKYNFARNRVSEWGINFSREKIYGTFAVTELRLTVLKYNRT